MRLPKDHFYAKDKAAWRAWLMQNHNTKDSVWLVFDKGKDRKLRYVGTSGGK